MRKVAKHAVKHIYQFTAPRPPGTAAGKQAVLEKTRLRLAEEFRRKHAARHDAADGTYPHFVGVFDTVAALISPPLTAGLAIAYALAAVVAAFVSSLIFSAYGERLPTFGWSMAIIILATFAIGAALYVYEHFKVDYGSGTEGLRKTWHLTDAYPKFYDVNLDPNIAYAKHAISIDENRASFKRVHWGHDNRHPASDPEGRLWFEQVWFSGNHADIGGSYVENESRLSDITLEWMVDCACEVPGDLRFDRSVLRTWPSALGAQHDRVAAGFGWITRALRITWPAAARPRPKDGVILDRTVYDRFEAEAVPYWDGARRYLPETLKDYPDVAPFYGSNVLPGTKAKRDSLARTANRPEQKRSRRKQAIVATTAFAASSHQINSVYAATATVAGSTSNIVTEQVRANADSVAITVNATGRNGSFVFRSTLQDVGAFTITSTGGMATRTFANVTAGVYTMSSTSIPVGFASARCGSTPLQMKGNDMARRVFFSFHYDRDVRRIVQVRNSWVVRPGDDAQPFYDKAEFEAAKERAGGIERWIEEQLKGTSVTVVLFGAETSQREWVIHEIQRSHALGKGLLAIDIHGVKDPKTGADVRGRNPLDRLTARNAGRDVRMSDLYSTYDWIADAGYTHMPTWIETAALRAGR